MSTTPIEDTMSKPSEAELKEQLELEQKLKGARKLRDGLEQRGSLERFLGKCNLTPKNIKCLLENEDCQVPFLASLKFTKQENYLEMLVKLLFLSKTHEAYFRFMLEDEMDVADSIASEHFAVAHLERLDDKPTVVQGSSRAPNTPSKAGCEMPPNTPFCAPEPTVFTTPAPERSTIKMGAPSSSRITGSKRKLFEFEEDAVEMALPSEEDAVKKVYVDSIREHASDQETALLKKAHLVRTIADKDEVASKAKQKEEAEAKNIAGGLASFQSFKQGEEAKKIKEISDFAAGVHSKFSKVIEAERAKLMCGVRSCQEAKSRWMVQARDATKASTLAKEQLSQLETEMSQRECEIKRLKALLEG